jgi:predicted histone-like DNA-binding protein
MSVFYRKYQNKNQYSVSYGKWFARAVTIGKTVTVDDLAKHMSEHNTPYSKGAIKGVLTDMIDCIRELMLEGKAVKLDGLAIFSAGIKTKKKGALTSEDFSTTKHIDSVYMRARATGEFTRAELTKAGNVTELPKNYTDYHEDDDEPQNPSGGSGSQNSGSSNSGNSGSQAETVAAPTISGETPFDNTTQVTLSGPDGAEIRYTVDGSAPTAESSLYSEALTLTDTVIVKAIAIKNGVSSEVASKTFTKNGSGDNGGGFDTGS